MEQPPGAKKMYMTMVMAMEARYMLSVDPTSRTCHTRDSVASIWSRQLSAHVCARSTSSTRPSSRNRMAPASAT
jgi:hypothetical protein